MFNKFFKGVDKKQAVSWAFYDFANSSYFLIVLSFIFPLFFKEVIASPSGDFWWGFAVSISIFLGGIATPFIGAIADYDKKRKKKFITFSILAIIGTSSLYFTGPNIFFLSILLFIVTNLCVEVSQTLYDSFLIRVSSKETSGRISGLGYALGYLGGIVAMIILKPFYQGGYEGALISTYKLTFPLTALIFLIFALPAFAFIKENKVKNKPRLKDKLKVGFGKVYQTLKNIKKHKNVGWFLLAFFIMNDALVTLFSFVSIYAKTTLSFSFSEIAIILLFIQIIALPSAVFLGYLSDKKGCKKVLISALIIWCLVVIGASLATTKTHFYLVAFGAGIVVGSSQAVARSWFTKIIPKNKMGEFFGFNGFASKIAAITGPLVFGTIATLTGNQRIAMLALLPYFVVSLIIFSRIKDQS